MKRYVKRIRALVAASVTIVFLFLAGSLSAQLIVYDTLTAQQLVQEVLIGSGVSASNITYTGAENAKGAFR